MAAHVKNCGDVPGLVRLVEMAGHLSKNLLETMAGALLLTYRSPQPVDDDALKFNTISKHMFTIEQKRRRDLMQLRLDSKVRYSRVSLNTFIYLFIYLAHTGSPIGAMAGGQTGTTKKKTTRKHGV